MLIFYITWEINLHPSKFNSKSKIKQDISTDGKATIVQHERIKSNSPIINSEEIVFRRNKEKGDILFSLDLDMSFRSLVVYSLF